jgi:Skp family chaperone for outer membrane proteins
MKRSTFIVAAASLALGIAAPRAISKEAPIKFGFLDVTRAFETYRRPKDVAEQLKAKRDDVLKSLRKRAKDIEDSVGKLETMNADTEEYIELDRRISAEKYLLDYDKKMAERQLEAEKRKKFAAIYKEISQECQAYGAEHDLAAVLLYQPPDAEQGADAYLFQATRAVLCRDDQLDVTTDVVARLNAQLPPVVPKAPPPAPTPDDKPPK